MAPSPALEIAPTGSSSPSPVPTTTAASNGVDSPPAAAAAPATIAPASERRANFATKNSSSAFGQPINAMRPSTITAVERRRLSSRPGFSERRRTSILVGQRSLDIMSELPTGEESKAPRFVSFIIKYYRKWGYFIADHDWQAIVICFIISAFAIAKILLTPQQNDITGYSPYGARAREEYTRYQEFFAHDGRGLAVYVFALAKDGGTMLRTSHLNETINVLDYTSSNFTLYNKKTNESKPFNDFCISFCQINEPVRQFFNGFEIQRELAEKGEPLTARMNLEYPISSMFGRQLSLQNNFYGIELSNHSSLVDDDIPENTTLSTKELTKRITNMKYVKMIVLQFRAEHEIGWEDEDIKGYEMKIVNYFKKFVTF
jgi:hypothetical protein